MITLLTCDSKTAPRVERILSATQAWHRAPHGWSGLVRAVEARGVLVVTAARIDASLSRRVRTWRHRRPDASLIMVTSASAENVRTLSDIPVDFFVWRTALESELPLALYRSRGRAFLRSASAKISASSHISPLLGSVLERSCLRPIPFSRVADMARAGAVERTTLWRHWNRACSGGPNLRMQDWCAWLLLIHAAGLRRCGRSWNRISSELGVHRDTLERRAAQLAGRTLAEVGSGCYRSLLDDFEAEFLTPLLEGSPATNCG